LDLAHRLLLADRPSASAEPAEVRRPRLELLMALALAAVWIIYRIGDTGIGTRSRSLA